MLLYQSESLSNRIEELYKFISDKSLPFLRLDFFDEWEVSFKLEILSLDTFHDLECHHREMSSRMSAVFGHRQASIAYVSLALKTKASLPQLMFMAQLLLGCPLGIIVSVEINDLFDRGDNLLLLDLMILRFGVLIDHLNRWWRELLIMVNLPSLSHIHRWSLLFLLDKRLFLVCRQGFIGMLIIFGWEKRRNLNSMVHVLLLDNLLKLLMVEAGVVIGLIILLSEPRWGLHYWSPIVVTHCRCKHLVCVAAFLKGILRGID